MKIYASEDFQDEVVYTPSALLDILSKIDELKEYSLNIYESVDGKIQLQVGDSVYDIQPSNELTIEVEDSVVDEVSDLNVDTYEELTESGDIEDVEMEPIESGLIKETLKTLLIGGVVRLAKGYMDSNKA